MQELDSISAFILRILWTGGEVGIMTLYRKLIRPMHCYPGHNYEPLTEPVEKEEKWYPEEEREFLEKKYASYNEGSFSDLVFEQKFEPYALELLKDQGNEYENGFNDAMQGKQELMYEGIDGKWHKKDW